MVKSVLRQITIPTVLTVIRFILIPFVAQALLLQQWMYALLLFVIASVTDLLDGMLARWLNQSSWLGRILDPLADKLLILVVYAVLLVVPLQGDLRGLMPHWLLWLVLGKELIVSTGVVVVTFLRKKMLIEPSMLGKFTMVAQVLFIIWVILNFAFGPMHAGLHAIFLWVTVSLIVLSLIQYAGQGIKLLTLKAL
ncbi:CDP-alcohol phosphatidyltransferase family protein [bacterium]|nr:CDP-alcohol phosphatidyltransferase family protein [bacterium]